MRPLVAAFAFLTRLPVWKGPLEERDLARSVAFFPVVGLVVGLVMTGAAFALGALLPAFVLAALVVAAAAALTGGLHLDGLADLFDAVGGGRGDRARTLEILRDSRVGAHGAAALVLALLAKVGAIAHLLGRQDLLPVLVAPAVARWAVTPLIILFPYARAEGLGRPFNGGAGRKEVALASAILMVLIASLGLRFVLPALGALAVAFAIGIWMHRRLGGLTGDVYGAAIELAEVAALAFAAGQAI